MVYFHTYNMKLLRNKTNMAAFIIFRMILLGSTVVNSCNLSTWERREEDSRVKSKNKTPPMDSTQRETTAKEEPGELVQAV